MPSEWDDLGSIFIQAIKSSFKYAVPRLGQVLKVEDDDQTGKILVSIPAFGWTTQDTGQWCYPKQERRLVTPKVDDWVIIEWIDGKATESQAVYSGIAYWMKDMLPKNYDGKSTTQLLFEDNNQELSIVYDEENKIIKLIHEGDEYSLNWDAKKLIIEDKEGQTFTFDTENKKIELVSTNDVTGLLDGQNKVIELNDSANDFKMDGNAGTVNIENQAGNTIEMNASSVKVNDTALEVLM